MEIKNYGFIIKASDYNRINDRVHLNSKSFSSTIIAVPSIEEACLAADELLKLGVDVIELCGGFEKEGYKKISSHIKNKIPVGYVVFDDSKL